MNRRKLSHVTAAGLLAALLMMPMPALAQPPHHHRASVDLWSWLAGAWQRGMISLGVGGLGAKGGMEIDPNGSKAPEGQGGAPTGGTTMSPGPGDQGHGIDPNG